MEYSTFCLVLFQIYNFDRNYLSAQSEKNCLSLYIPEGFAHAYLSSDKLNIIYNKLSNYWQPKYEDGLLWNDKFLKIKWPIKKPFISKKDMKLKTFFQFKKTYKGF